MTTVDTLLVRLTLPPDVEADIFDEYRITDLDHYSVVALRWNSDKSVQFMEHLREAAPHVQRIVVIDKFDIKTLKEIVNSGGAFRVLTESEMPLLGAAIEDAKSFKKSLEGLPQDPKSSDKLKSLTDDLESLIDRRQKNLFRAQKRALTVNRQIDALHRALLAVHEAKSVAEVETLLLTVLQESLELVWVRVFYVDPDDLDTHLSRLPNIKYFRTPLKVGNEALGFIVFARMSDSEFAKSENELLHQVSESVALALDRLAKQDQSETLKQQWDSTFNAISEPLCLTDDKFVILRTNSKFSQTLGVPEPKLVGQNAFALFADPESPLTPQAADRFLIQRREPKTKEPRFYEVTSQRVGGGEKPVIMILFRDVTEQKRIERQIFESSKMAELGTIGSSIAHELNNPLAGMMSFLQLIKMDLPSTDPIRADVEEMEVASRRCKEIVENLLSFSRRQSSLEIESIDLREVMDQALKIVELQTRSLGIEVAVRRPDQAVRVNGQYNVLSQALSHVLQNAVEAVSDRLAQTPGFAGQIHVDFETDSTHAIVIIRDNGVGISPEHQSKIFDPLFSTKRTKTGLGLSLAYKIIHEHSGQLEIFSQPNIGTRVKISFLKV